MTDNIFKQVDRNVIYQQLCDKVGAYEEVQKEHFILGVWTNKNYPPQSAEQILRLEELVFLNLKYPHRVKISSKGYLYKWHHISNLKTMLFKFANIKTRPNALCSLVIKLTEEGVLSCEQVREAITND